MIAAGTAVHETTMSKSIELEVIGPSWGGSPPAYGIAVDRAGGSRVLAPIEEGRLVTDSDRVVPVELPGETALLLPFVFEALRVWDLLQLEIGAASVVTPGPAWAPLFELTAAWYGGIPVPVGRGEAKAEPFDSEAVGRFSRTLAGYPAVCAVELTGRSEMVDALLEAVPPSSRVMFAGPRGDRFTIDYYVNVHKKGLHLASTVLSPARLFDPRQRDRVLTGRAVRLLASTARAQACHAAIAAGAPGR
jgi:hypothetical protein